MNIVTAVTDAPRRPMARLLAPYIAELHAELRRTWRTPAFVLPCLLFPVLFYVMFGVMLGRATRYATCWRPTASLVRWARPCSASACSWRWTAPVAC